MAQTVTILRDFSLCNCTVVEWTRGKSTEYIVARGIHITERFLNGRLHTGEEVTCYWDSGTYFDTKEGAMRVALEREAEAVRCLQEIYSDYAEITEVEKS